MKKIICVVVLVLGMAYVLTGITNNAFSEVKWSQAGNKMVIAFDDKTLQVLNSEGELIREIKSSGTIMEYCISPDDENLLYVAEGEGLVKVNINSGNKNYIYNGNCINISWSPNGNKIIYTVFENTILSNNSQETARKICMVNVDGSGKKVLKSNTTKIEKEIEPAVGNKDTEQSTTVDNRSLEQIERELMNSR